MDESCCGWRTIPSTFGIAPEARAGWVLLKGRKAVKASLGHPCADRRRTHRKRKIKMKIKSRERIMSKSKIKIRIEHVTIGILLLI